MYHGRLKEFGIGTYSYNFVDFDVLYPLVPVVNGSPMRVSNAQVIGIDGAYNSGGLNRARSGVLTLQTGITLRANGHDQMEQRLRALQEMKQWGEKRLFKTTADNLDMWAWATCLDVVGRLREDDTSYLQADVDITFNIPRARWYRKSDMSFFDSGFTVGDGITLSTPQIEAQSVGDGSTVNLTNNGNAYAGVYVRWDIPTGETATNPTITRQNEIGQDVDVLAYTGTLSGDDVLIMDARNHSTTLNMIANPDYENVDAATGAWLEVPPGTITLNISGTFSANANLTLDIWDTYL